MIRLILIGHAGGGKSSLGNLLLSREGFVFRGYKKGVSSPEIEEIKVNNLSIVVAHGYEYSLIDEHFKKLLN